MAMKRKRRSPTPAGAKRPDAQTALGPRVSADPVARRVIVQVPPEAGYPLRALMGVCDFAERHGGWTVLPMMDARAPERIPERAIDEMRTWQPDGILAFIDTPKVHEQLAGLGCKVIDMGNFITPALTPRVGVDDVAVGRMAADHLVDCGLRHFAFCGHWGQGFSYDRWIGFAGRLAEHGFAEPAKIWPGRTFRETGRGRIDVELFESIQRIAKPLGVLASNDRLALPVLEACRLGHIDVPDDVAVLGVDDLSYFTRLSRPPLSSIATPAEAAGWAAADLLESLMSGEPEPKRPVLLPPMGVVPRQSTDVVNVEDADLREAVRVIRQHAPRGLDVSGLLSRVAMSRRRLEQLFRRHLGRSPLQEIHRVRVESAKALLAGGDASIEDVAKRCGFRRTSRFTPVFHRLTGLTPGAYRRRFGR